MAEFEPGSIAKQFVKTTGGGFQQGSVASQFVGSGTRNIDSSQGLYNLAVQSGLKDKADNIWATQSGEETKKIFSGGFISDIFDVMNTFQYGVVGLMKGKSFLEGVQTRQSFTDKDALGDKGLPGVVAGIALDIAFDPLTYIAPATIVKKIPFATKLIKGAKEAIFGKTVIKELPETALSKVQQLTRLTSDTEGGTKMGKYLASKLSWMWGADPVFRETFERSTKNIAVETQNLVEMARHVSKLAPETAIKILSRDKTGRFIRAPLEGLVGTLTSDELLNVQKFYQKIDDLGKQAVDVGLLGKAKFEENVGEYIKSAFLEHETAVGKGFFGFKKAGIKGIKARKEVEHISEFGLTQVDNPAYLLFKSAFDLTKDVENAKLLKNVAERFSIDAAQEGFAKMPGGQKWGKLAEKYVPQYIHDYLNEIITPSQKTIGKQLVANFKFFKVIMNPATHARNTISNKILNWWKLGMNPLDPRTISSEFEAGKEIFKGVGKWSDEARPLGYSLDTFASAEMKGLLDGPEVSAWGKTISGWSNFKKKLGNIYQAEENHAKLSAYIFNRKKGFSPEEAWKAAESATFNYAQVTPFIRKVRESLFGFPFITFTVKATPVVLETAVKAPHRISAIGKIKQGIEKLADIEETERERKVEPPWVKDGFYIKLPMKDKEGRSAYFDLTYILPFGDLMAGNFFERQINRATGLPESYATALTKKAPFISLVSDIGKNQDFFGNKIWLDSDSSEKQLGDLMIYITKMMSPPLVGDTLAGFFGGYNEKGERQPRGIVGALTTEQKDTQRRTLMQELLRNVGAKIQPIDADIQENYQELNRKRAMQLLLLENGVLRSFNRAYIPKQ